MKRLLKSILPGKAVEKVQRTTQVIDYYLIRIFVKSKWLSGLYYSLFNQGLNREAQSVLAGRIKHDTDLAAGSQFKLRRNIHRLEKGLIMKPRRAVFAEAYIVETVKSYALCVSENGYCEAERKWAQDVLLQYFEVVEKTPTVNEASRQFFDVHESCDVSEHQFIPYSSDKRPEITIKSESLYELFRARRSVRWFEQRPVDMREIERAVEMAAQAPSACNRQPFHFYVINEPERAQRIASIPMGTKGFSQNVQSLVVLVGDLSAYPKERDRHVIYIDGGLVAMQFMLALETLQLSSCPINWPDMEAYEKRMEKELALKAFQRPIMLMAIGYADKSGDIPYSQKKSIRSLIKEVK